jgi:hypothetical protein
MLLAPALRTEREKDRRPMSDSFGYSKSWVTRPSLKFMSSHQSPWQEKRLRVFAFTAELE